MKTLWIVPCFLLFTFAAAQAQTSDNGLTKNSTFQKNCAKCHGKTAEGRHFHGPSLVSEKTTGMSEEDLHNIITNGEHHMPKFAGKLTPDEINTLVAEIKAGQHK